MDFSEIKRLPLGDALNAVVSEGGATAGGFVGAGVAGRRIQAALGSTDANIVTTTDALKAAAYNNGPKIAGWYLLRGRNLFGAATSDVQKGIVTSVAFDLLMRGLNGGKNPATATVFGYEAMGENTGINSANSPDVNALIQENNAMKAELSRIRSAEGAYSPRLPPYVGGAGIMKPDERDRRYAFMPGMGTPGVTKTPGVEPRQRRYGFAGEVAPLSSVGKPGAAYVQAGKMFGMK